MGIPHEYPLRYYNDNADELIFMDSVESLYSRKHTLSIINKVTKNIFY